MGSISKTITINVPAKVIYDIMKESIISNWAEIYYKDLISWYMVGSKQSIIRDVPNKMISTETGGWGAKVTIDIFLKEIDNKFTEVTLHVGYFLAVGDSVKAGMMSMIDQMIFLEKGYIAGIANVTCKNYDVKD